MNSIHWRRAGCGLVLLGFAGCASIPPPHEQLAAAKAEVAKAETSPAAQFAPLELQTARSKLNAANAAMQNEEYLKAKRLSEQAEVDAKLAWTKAETAQARKAAAEIEEGIRVLREELQRKAM
jgi:hypothetical protein